MKLKILLSLLCFGIVLSFALPHQSYAQTVSPSSATSYQMSEVEPDVPQNLNTYSQNVVIDLMSALSCQVFGVDPSRPNTKCLGVNPQTGKIGFVQDGGGLTMIMSKMIGSLYYFPVGSGQYTQYMAHNFIGHKQSYAQITDRGEQVGGGAGRNTPQTGFGFGGLHPFLAIWTVFRNIAYLFYIAGFVFVGLGIVLRLPVDSRAVMSLQNQIPKIIISLILLTFSYAIAGFLIDLMYIIIFLVFNIVNNNATLSSYNVASLNPIELQGANPFAAVGSLGGIGGLAHAPAASVGDLIGSVFSGTTGGIVSGLITGLIGGIVGFTIGGPIGALIGGLGGGALAGLGVGTGVGISLAGEMVAFFVIAFALISSLFRIWFKLISSYVMFLFTLILGPFWIMGGIFPGMKFSFGAWVKTMIGHLSVFPTVVVMFMLGKVIIAAVIAAGNQPLFVPPLIGDAGGLKGLASLIGLGVILATPSIMDNVKGSFGTSGIPTQSIGQAIGTGQALGGTMLGGLRAGLWSTNRHGHATGLVNAIGMPWFWNRFGGGHSHTDDHGRALRPNGRPYAAGLAGGLQRTLDFARRRRGNNATAANVAHTNGQNNHNNDDDNNHGTGGNPATPPNPPHNPPPPPGFRTTDSGLVIPTGSGRTGGGTGTGGGTPPTTS